MKGYQTLEAVDVFQDVKKIREDAKINSEISKAIKRQRETTGVEYWRTTPSTKVQLPNAQRRSAIDKIHNLKFEYTNGMFPVISQSRKTFKAPVTPVGRLKKKLSAIGFDDFKRSNSELNLSVPRISNANRILTPRKAYVADLTCLQLMDTILSTNSVSSTNFDVSVGKTRYVNYLIDMDRLKSTKDFEALPSISTVPVTSKTQLTTKQGIGDDNSDLIIDTYRCVDDNYVEDRYRQTENQEEAGTSGDVKHRSILKPSGLCKDASSTKSRDSNLEICSKYTNGDNKNKTTNQKDRADSTHGIDHRTKSSLTNFNCAVRLLDDSDLRNGRSVRFSISDEIYEYMPTEPICI